MARGKKEASLTLEEKLEAALVPEEEQPYVIPENWCWVYSPNIFSIEYGKGLSTKELTDEGYPVFGANGQIGYYNSFMYETPQALMSCRGAYSGTMNISLPKSFVTSNSLIIQAKCRDVSPQYISYLFGALNTGRLVSGSAQPQVTVQAFNGYPVPLIPINEQHRIIERIESLFLQLDEARDKVQEILDSIEDRKASILKKAFSGELTAKWRKENHISLAWDNIKFEECIDIMQNGISKRKGTEGELFVVIRLANLSDNGFVTDDLREIVLDEKEQRNYELKEDDVLMIRVNGSKDNVGKQILVSNQKKWAFCDHIIRIRYKENILPQYMVYYSKGKEYKEYIMDNMVSSAGQNTISRKGMSGLSIPVPGIQEQKIIVEILKNCFEKEDDVFEQSKEVISMIDVTKKSILAKAFRGELGTNDPDEDNAVELLQTILDITKEDK